MQPPNERAAYAANTVYAALCAAKAACEIKDSESPDAEVERVTAATMIARDAAIAADDNVARSARLDWEALGRLSLGRFPDFGEAVDAGENGLLGPLFQDFSRGLKGDTAPTPGAAADRNKPNPSTTGWMRNRHAAELTGIPTVARAEQIAEIDGLRKQIEADRRQFQDDRAAFDAEKQALHMQLFKELAKLDQERQRIQSDQHQIVRHIESKESYETELASRQTALEAREQELVSRCTAVDSREHELQARQDELESREDNVVSYLADIENREAQLEAEKNATRAAFESLKDERREFLEQRLRWMSSSARS